MRLTHVRIKNFRAIREADIEIPPFAVLIGPNGAGKTSFLEIVKSFGELITGKYPGSFSRTGSFMSNTSYRTTVEKLSIGTNFCEQDYHLGYELELAAEGSGYYVIREGIDSELTSKERIRLDRNDTQVKVIRDLNGMRQEQTSRFGHGVETCLVDGSYSDVLALASKKLLDKLKILTFCEPSRFQPNERMRQPQQLQPSLVPNHDGSDLFSVLYNLHLESRPVFEELCELLRIAIPQFHSMDFPVFGAGYINLRWRQTDLRKELWPNQLSDGTIRLLWLLTILLTVPDDGIVLIDEPEISLHPQWLMLLVSVMRKASARTNVIVATQSAEFVKWVQPEELIIADLDENGATLRRASDRSDLNNWLKDFTLDELWTMGELGGRR